MLGKKFWRAPLSDRTMRSVEILKTSNGLIDTRVSRSRGS